MSSSRLNDLYRYQQSRFPLGIYVPLALFLVAAAHVGGPGLAFPWASRLLLAGCLLLQFRLWDDLCDRGRDEQDNPERVLVGTAHLAVFRAVLVCSLLVNILLLGLLATGLKLGVFLALNGVLLVWYGGLRHLCASQVVAYHVTLAKYPVFVYLLSVSAEPLALPQLYAATLVYLCLCVHEVLHDPKMSAARGAGACLAMEMSAMATIAILMAVYLGPLGDGAALIQALAAFTGSAGLVFLFHRHLTRHGIGAWRFAVFVISFGWLLTFSLGTAASGVVQESEHRSQS